MHQVNSGDLLISPTLIPDSRFRKSVMMMTHSHQGHHYALCLNRPSEHLVTDILKDVAPGLQLDIPLYWGGPCSSSTIWMLHDAEWSTEHTFNIDQHWSMTSNVEMFQELAEGNRPDRFRVMFGFASWAPNQLARELEGEAPWSPKHSWLIAHKPDPDWLMDMPEEDLWAASIGLSGNQAVAQWIP